MRVKERYVELNEIKYNVEYVFRSFSEVAGYVGRLDSRYNVLESPLQRPPSTKPGAESPVIYDFIRRYTIRPYLKVEAFFMPAVQATLNDRISMVSAASRRS